MRAQEQECNTPPRLQDAVCLASSRICVQNLIHFGNSLRSALRFKERRFVLSLAPRLAKVMGAACNSVSMPHFTDVFNEKF